MTVFFLPPLEGADWIPADVGPLVEESVDYFRERMTPSFVDNRLAALKPAAVPASYTVELHGVPAGATVLINGKPAAGTKLQVLNDGHSRLIEVQAVGRRPWRVMHPAGNAGNYEVRLPVLPTVLPTVSRTHRGA